jgi:hypothetical protein
MPIPVEQIAMRYPMAHIISRHGSVSPGDQGFILNGEELEFASVSDDSHPNPVAIPIQRVEPDEIRLVPHNAPAGGTSALSRIQLRPSMSFDSLGSSARSVERSTFDRHESRESGRAAIVSPQKS